MGFHPARAEVGTEGHATYCHVGSVRRAPYSLQARPACFPAGTPVPAGRSRGRVSVEADRIETLRPGSGSRLHIRLVQRLHGQRAAAWGRSKGTMTMASAAQRLEDASLAIQDPDRERLEDRLRKSAEDQAKIGKLLDVYEQLANLALPLDEYAEGRADGVSMVEKLDGLLCRLSVDEALATAHEHEKLARRYDEAKRAAGERVRVIRAAVALASGLFEAIDGEAADVLTRSAEELKEVFPSVGYVMEMTDQEVLNSLAEPIPAP
jgi:hypothetical protein